MKFPIASIFVLFFSSNSSAIAHEAQKISLEDLVKAGNKKASEVARNEDSGKKISGYSRERAFAQGEGFKAKTEEHLKSEAAQQIINARANDKSSSGATITLKSGERSISDLEGMAKQEMISKAKEIFVDPLKSFNGITKEECSRILENQKLQKTNKVREQKKTIEYEEKNCEVANIGISCEKFLEVACEARDGDCDRGEISLKRKDQDVVFGYQYPTMTIERIHNAIRENKGQCMFDDSNIVLDIRKLESIKEFKIKEVGFHSFVWIKVNDTTVYIDGNMRSGISGKRNGWKMSDKPYPLPEKMDRVEVINTIDSNNCGYEGIRCVSRPVSFVLLTEDKNDIDGCHHENSQKQTAIDLDLLGMLKEGENKIWIRIVFAPGYKDGKIFNRESLVKISAKQQCCSKFKEEWRKRCYPN